MSDHPNWTPAGELADRIRPPAVAGTFYPDDAEELAWTIDRDLGAATYQGPPPKAVIAPHAGYVFSGPTAAYAYRALESICAEITTVVVIAPSHRYAFDGVAITSATAYRTPLGDAAIDLERYETVAGVEGVSVIDEAHVHEHSVEVQIPFIQRIISKAAIVPIVVGRSSTEQVAGVLEALWGGDETAIVVSSDLSHYEDYETANRLDTATAANIVACRSEEIDYADACGAGPIRGLLAQARRRAMTVEALDLRNSADTAGDRRRVVGYGAFAFVAR